MVTKLILGTTSHLSARCRGMFSSFMIKQIRINDARLAYSVFLARLFPATFETCPKIKHHWPKSEPRVPDIEVYLTLAGNVAQRIREIIGWINPSHLAT